VERPHVVVIISTGRCGTQWLTAGLRELHPGVAVEHEPLGPLYKPRRYLRHPDPLSVLGEPEVATHFARVAMLAVPYIETGWPLFGAVPAFASRFGARLRIVHLTRHPVPTALSHLAHSSYAGSPRADAYTRWATLGPRDARVLQRGYDVTWDRLTPYEKCLFWWTEVHAYALELHTRLADVPWLTVASESMLAGDEAVLRRLVRFLGLEWDERWLPRVGRVVDRWHHHTAQDVDPLVVERHHLTCLVAKRLGYDPLGVDAGALSARYHGAPDPGRDRIGRYGVV
jgi:hypothetical protein